MPSHHASEDFGSRVLSSFCGNPNMYLHISSESLVFGLADGRTRLCSNRALGLHLQNSHPLLHFGWLRHWQVSQGSRPFWSNPNFGQIQATIALFLTGSLWS